MEELLDLILYENENTRLDFKRDEYRKENYTSFLKDIISMANANTKEPRFIIIGLKPKSIDDRGFSGVKEELIDAATFQQLVYENIEPEISVDYFPFKSQGFLFGVFKISNCENPPYLMKKDFGDGKNRLYRGEGYIRKGTHQTRIIRADYNKYFQNKIDEQYFNEEVILTLTSSNYTNEVELISIEGFKRPSLIKREEIEKILEQKKQDVSQYNRLGFNGLDIVGMRSQMSNINAIFQGTGIPYKDRDIATLEKNLENIDETYFENDCYELFEVHSNKCNISILNKGHKYIEDASIILKIPKMDGLLVLEKVYRKPSNNFLDKIEISSGNYYPQVTSEEDFYVIKESIGDIKHQNVQDVFRVQLRIFATTKLTVDSFKIKCDLFAKNIKTVISQEILIKVRKATKNT